MKNPEKFGGGRWNGFGGEVEPGETIEEAAVREAFEEGGINVINLKKLGNILFRFKTDEPNHDVYFYKAEDYEGELKESSEMKKYEWFKENHLPLDNMWPADRYWLPLFIQGKMFKGNVCFDKEFQVSSYEIIEVNNLD